VVARWRPVLVGLAVIVLGVGVGVGARALRGADQPEPAALRLRATAEQWRDDEVQRKVAVALHNDGGAPVRVSRVELVLPSFAGAGTLDTNALLPVGGLRVDVSVPYGTGRCPDLRVSAPDSAPAEVIVDARPDAGGATSRLRLALPYPNVLLDRLLRDDCAQQRLHRSVVLSLGPWRPRADGTLAGAVILAAGPDREGPVSLVELDGSIHTDLRPVGPARSPLITLTEPAATVELPVIADAARCDPHAVAEAKKPFEFPAFVAVGADRIATTLPITDVDRLALDTMLRTRCKHG
jgi:hypothetical protein